MNVVEVYSETSSAAVNWGSPALIMALLPGCLKNEWSWDPFSTFCSAQENIRLCRWCSGFETCLWHCSVAEMMCVDGALALSSEPILVYKTLRLLCKLHHESLGHSDYSQLRNMLSTEKKTAVKHVLSPGLCFSLLWLDIRLILLSFLEVCGHLCGVVPKKSSCWRFFVLT